MTDGYAEFLPARPSGERPQLPQAVMRPGSTRALSRAAMRPGLALAVVAIALAACSGGSGGGGGPVGSPSAGPSPPPAPAPDPAPVQPASIDACFNPGLFSKEGTVVSARYRSTVGSVTGEVRHTETVGTVTRFNDYLLSRITVQETMDMPGSPSQSFDGVQYVELRDRAVMFVAMRAQLPGGTTAAQIIDLRPPRPDLDFSLSEGQSREGATTAEVTFEPAAPAQRMDLQTRLTFAGFETVTVPAGTFANACRFTLESRGSSVRTVVRWIAAGSGVMVKATGASATQELLSATIDGSPVAP